MGALTRAAEAAVRAAADNVHSLISPDLALGGNDGRGFTVLSERPTTALGRDAT
jgi:hypothetical protein